MKHFVIDTSRNGQGPWTPPADHPAGDPQDWCNPPDRGLGYRPTVNTGQSLMDFRVEQARLKGAYPIPHGGRICMHEFVAQGIIEGSDPSAGSGQAVRALDIAKRLIDYDFHPPTNYFPLIVHEALMIEPTEMESKQTLDQFVDAMWKIAQEAKENPQLLREAPHIAPTRRLDEVRAAKQLILCATFPQD